MALQSTEAAEPTSISVPWVYLSSLVFLLSGAIFYLYLARVLPPNDLGAVVILSAIAAVMAVAFSLGIGPGFQHFLSYHLGRSETAIVQSLVRSAFFYALALSVASAVTTLALSTAFSDLFFHTRAYATAITILAVFAGVQTANSALQSVLLGLQRFVSYSLVFISSSIAIYGFAVGFLVIWPGVDSIVTGWASGASLGCALAVLAIVRVRGRRNSDSGMDSRTAGASLHRSLVAYSLPLFVWSVLATGATYVDRLVLASVADLASVGVYNYALLIASGSLVIVGPFATILVSKASSSFGQGDRQELRTLTRGAITMIALVYVPISLGIAALGPFLLRVLVGPGFVTGSLAMALLLVASAVVVPYSILSSVAAGTRRTMAFAKAAGLALCANIVLSVVLVPRVGMVGAAIGNSSMVWVPFAVFYLELRNTGLVAFDLRSLSRIWLASLAMAAVVGVPLALLGYDLSSVAIFVVAGILVLAVLLRLLGAISVGTAASLLGLLPRRLGALRHVIYWLAPTCQTPTVPASSGVGLSLQR